MRNIDVGQGLLTSALLFAMLLSSMISKALEGRDSFLTFLIVGNLFTVILGLIDGIIQIRPDMQSYFPVGIATKYYGTLPTWFKLWLFLAPFIYFISNYSGLLETC